METWKISGIHLKISLLYDQKQGKSDEKKIKTFNVYNAIYYNSNFHLKKKKKRIGEPTTHLLGWNVSPEELPSIPDHWLSQAEPNHSVHYLLGTLYIAFFFVAIIGNGLVLWVFTSYVTFILNSKSIIHSIHSINILIFVCRAKSLRTPSNVFVINLAFCDFMMMSKTPIFIYNSFNHGYALGSTGCQVFALMGSLSGIGAAITNACIAYDRLLK